MTTSSLTPSALSSRLPEHRRSGWPRGAAVAVAGLLSLLSLSGQGHAQPAVPFLSFVSERDGQRDVYRIAGDGRGEQRLTSGPEDESNGPSTPDGKHLLITVAAPKDAMAGFRFWLLPLSAMATPVSLRSSVRDRGLGLLPAPRALLRDPSFLPDGQRLVFESEPDVDPATAPRGLREIFVTSLADARSARPALRQLSRNPEGNFAPTVCGRSDYIAFTSSRDRRSELYRMRVDGSDVRRLTYCRGSKWQPTCSPDGLRIFFVSDRDGADRIYSVHRNGSEPTRLTRQSLDPTLVEDSPSVSPDGRKLAYVLRAAGLGARLHVLDLPSQRDCEVPTPPGSYASDPDWSPRRGAAGSRLAFTLQPAHRAGQPAESERQIFASDERCQPITAITTARGPNWHPLWIR